MCTHCQNFWNNPRMYKKCKTKQDTALLTAQGKNKCINNRHVITCIQTENVNRKMPKGAEKTMHLVNPNQKEIR